MPPKTLADFFVTPITDNVKLVRSFVSSTVKGAVALASYIPNAAYKMVPTNSSSSSSSLVGTATSSMNDIEGPFDVKPAPIQINLSNLVDNVLEISPLFYEDEFLPFQSYQTFLTHYSHLFNNFITNYFKMKPSVELDSKQILELYELCHLITKKDQPTFPSPGQSNNNTQSSSTTCCTTINDMDKCIQKYLFEVVAVDSSFHVHLAKDKTLHKKLKLFQNILQPKHLGLPDHFFKSRESTWNDCVHSVRKLNQYKTPYGKKGVMEQIFRGVSDLCQSIDETFNSDHLLSCTIYLILVASPHNFHSDVWFLVTFCLEGIYEHEGNELFGFTLTTLYCALEFWDSLSVPQQTQVEGEGGGSGVGADVSGYVDVMKASASTSLNSSGSNSSNSNNMINELKSGSSGGSSPTLMTLDQSEEQLFKTFRVSEEEKIKFKKALKRARRKTQTLERMIIKDEYY